MRSSPRPPKTPGSGCSTSWIATRRSSRSGTPSHPNQASQACGLNRRLRDVSVRLAVAIDDPTARQVVRRQLELDPVADQDLDPVTAHLAGRVAESLVAVVESDAVHAALVGLDDFAVHFDLLLLFGDSAPPFSMRMKARGRRVPPARERSS